jgi:hypothetical protein
MKTGAIEVLQIDLDKKNLLIVHISEVMDPDLEWFRSMTEKLQDWVSNDSPLFVLGAFDGVEVRLEKLEKSEKINA